MERTFRTHAGRVLRISACLLALAGTAVPPARPAFADYDTTDFEIPVTPVVKPSDLTGAGTGMSDAERSDAAAKFVIAEINEKRKPLADAWGMELFSAEIVQTAPAYFIVKYSYDLLNLPSHMSDVSHRYCALLYERQGREWRAGECFYQFVDKNTRVRDIDRDGRLEIDWGGENSPGEAGKGPDRIPRGFTSLGDLNGDAAPEFMKTDQENVREYGSVRQSIVTWNSREKKFLATGLAAQTRTSGGCGFDNIIESLSVDALAQPYPAVLIKRTVKQSDAACAERVTLEAVDRFQWDPAFKQYVTQPTAANGGTRAAVRRAVLVSEEFPVQRIAQVSEGKVKELDKSFDLKTALSDLAIRGHRVYFKAEDVEWRSEYAWSPLDGKLDFKALNKKTGKTAFSRPLKSNVFRKQQARPKPADPEVE